MNTVAIPAELLVPHLLPAFQAEVQAWLAQQPKPDQQYTIEETAAILKVSPDSVGDYLRLPADHPRRLRHVVTHDSHKGKRIPLSAIQEWQQRNNCDAIAAADAAKEAQLISRPHRAVRRQRGTA